VRKARVRVAGGAGRSEALEQLPHARQHAAQHALRGWHAAALSMPAGACGAPTRIQTGESPRPAGPAANLQILRHRVLTLTTARGAPLSYRSAPQHATAGAALARLRLHTAAGPAHAQPHQPPPHAVNWPVHRAATAAARLVGGHQARGAGHVCAAPRERVELRRREGGQQDGLPHIPPAPGQVGWAHAHDVGAVLRLRQPVQRVEHCARAARRPSAGPPARGGRAAALHQATARPPAPPPLAVPRAGNERARQEAPAGCVSSAAMHYEEPACARPLAQPWLSAVSVKRQLQAHA